MNEEKKQFLFKSKKKCSPLNCISHSRTDSISIVSKSLKSSYSSVSELVTLNVAKPRDASRPPNAAYGPPFE